MKKLKKIYIEITNICNLSCHFCPGTSRAPIFMERELFEKILKEIDGFTNQVYFHVMGEPLLHPDIDLFLDICNNCGLKVNITTNGTLIGRHIGMLLSKPALRQVNFSLHSCEANSRVNMLDEYLDDIFQFIEKSRKAGKLLIGLRIWNISDKGENEFNRHILHRIRKRFSLDTDLSSTVTPVNGLKLSDNIFLHIAEVFDWPDMAAGDVGHRGFCYGLRDQAAVLSDGTVVPCCLDSEGTIKLGNIKEQSFERIINSERARSLYNGFSRREAVEELCRKCGYRTRFNI